MQKYYLEFIVVYYNMQHEKAYEYMSKDDWNHQCQLENIVVYHNGENKIKS